MHKAIFHICFNGKILFRPIPPSALFHFKDDTLYKVVIFTATTLGVFFYILLNEEVRVGSYTSLRSGKPFSSFRYNNFKVLDYNLELRKCTVNWNGEITRLELYQEASPVVAV